MKNADISNARIAEVERMGANMMEGERLWPQIIAPHRLRQFLTHLVSGALPWVPPNAGGAEEKELDQLGGAIVEHGRMVHQLYLKRSADPSQPVRVEVRELAFCFRESTNNNVAALVRLEGHGQARRTKVDGLQEYLIKMPRSIPPETRLVRS